MVLIRVDLPSPVWPVHERKESQLEKLDKGEKKAAGDERSDC
jgi:hypothetical protein